MQPIGMRQCSLVIFALCVLGAAPARADVQVVAAGGANAPDGNGQLFDFDIPAMNASGQVVFVSTLNGTTGGANDNTGIFRGTTVPGSLTVIVRKGAPSPDTNGNFALLDADSVPVINAVGQVAFVAGLSGTFGGSRDDTGIFRSDGTPAGFTAIVREGQDAPGGGTFPDLRGGGVQKFSFNDRGEVIINAIGLGIFRATGSTITPIARIQQPVPGGGGLFAIFTAAASNDNGQVAFAAVPFGLFRGDGTTIDPIARPGDAAPDGNGSFFALFGDPAINNAGDVAFYDQLMGTTGSTSDNQGLFISKGGTLMTIVRRGQTAPDGNGRFLDLSAPDNVAINDTGQVAFVSTLTATSGGATDSSGLFRGDGMTLKQIVRTGHRVPDGSVINSIGEPALNNAGQVAFVAGLLPAGGQATVHGIFVYDDQRGLLEAVRTGDALLGSRIAVNSTLIFRPSVAFTGRKRGSLNDQGQVVFRFDLDDGRRGVAVANPFVMSATATASPTPTETPQPSVTPTQRRTTNPTPPPTVAASCPGDCDGSGDVTVNEVLTLVNIALENASASACSAGIPARREVDIGLMLQAVNAALDGCPHTTPTPGRK